MTKKTLQLKAVELLKMLIQTPSYSGEEAETAALLESFMSEAGIACKRFKNNVWAVNRWYDPEKPSILLNSHHDTVKPVKSYTRDPFAAEVADQKLFGLGSNDAGASLVSLLASFEYFYERKDLNYNLVFAASAEEENSGLNGMRSLINELPPIQFAIVGEPTQMQMAVAEKGLLVIDAYAKGISGHAANENTQNAIYTALKDIAWVQAFVFPKVSDQLGKVKMSVTQINAGTQHNVVPDQCHFVIDVRVNEHYTNREVFEMIDEHTQSDLRARSFHLKASSMSPKHPLVAAGLKHGSSIFGSSTLSDQVFLPFPSVKMGPGNTERSHQANEYIVLSEIEEAIELYIHMLNELL